MPSTTQPIVQPPFSLAQLLNEQIGATNPGPLNVSSSGLDAVTLNLPDLSAGSILWVTTRGLIQAGSGATNIGFVIEIDADQGDVFTWFGTSTSNPGITHSNPTTGALLASTFAGIARATVDVTGVVMRLTANSFGADSTIPADGAGLQVFVLRT